MEQKTNDKAKKVATKKAQPKKTTTVKTAKTTASKPKATATVAQDKKAPSRAKKSVTNKEYIFGIDRDKFVTMCLVVAIIVAIVLVLVFAVIKPFDKDKSGGNDGNTNITTPNEQQQTDNGSTDLSNTENVVIEGNKKTNNSSKLKEEKTYDGMKVKDIKLYSEKGLTNFTATVENTSGEDKLNRPIQIVFTDENGAETSVLPGYLGDVKAGEVTYIDASTTADLSNSYDCYIRNEQ